MAFVAELAGGKTGGGGGYSSQVRRKVSGEIESLATKKNSVTLGSGGNTKTGAESKRDGSFHI